MQTEIDIFMNYTGISGHKLSQYRQNLDLLEYFTE